MSHHILMLQTINDGETIDVFVLIEANVIVILASMITNNTVYQFHPLHPRPRSPLRNILPHPPIIINTVIIIINNNNTVILLLLLLLLIIIIIIVIVIIIIIIIIIIIGFCPPSPPGFPCRSDQPSCSGDRRDSFRRHSK